MVSEKKTTQRSLSAREQMIGWITLSLVLFYGIRAWIFQPASQYERLMDQEIIETHKIIKKNQVVLQSKQHASLPDDPVLSSFFRSGTVEAEMTELTALLETLANQSGLTITEMKPLSVKDREYYQLISVDINLEGRYQQMIDFLYSVQNNPNFLSVDELNLEAKPIADGTMFCRSSVSRMLLKKDQP